MLHAVQSGDVRPVCSFPIGMNRDLADMATTPLERQRLSDDLTMLGDS